MNEVLAEINLSNASTNCIYISKLSFDVFSQKVNMSREEQILLSGKQGFVWYPDFIVFKMLVHERNYWVKLMIAETLEIDPTLIKMMESKETYSIESVIVLPFQVADGDRLSLFGIDDDLILSFTLPIGHYQLLFQNRLLTREEIEASPNNDCQDWEYDDCDYIRELCLLTFIPTNKAMQRGLGGFPHERLHQEVIEPEILVYRGSLNKKKSPIPLVLFEREINQNKDN